MSRGKRKRRENPRKKKIHGCHFERNQRVWDCSQQAILTECVPKISACYPLILFFKSFAERTYHFLWYISAPLLSLREKLSLFILKKFHLNSKRYVRTIRSSDFRLLGTYVHTFFTWNEKFYSLSGKEKITAR